MENYQPTLEGLNGKMLKIGTWEHSSFQRRKFHENENFAWEGLTFTLLDVIAEHLNFSYHLVEPPDGEWGIKQDNGNWSGLIGMVINKEVDFAAGDFSVTADREMEVDFASPYYHDQSVVTFQRPKDDRMLLYMKPFKWQVWLSLLIAVSCCGPLLWFLTVKSPAYNSKHRQATKGLFKLDVAVLSVFKAYLTQGSNWTPYNQAGRFLVGCVWMSVVVIVGTYTGNLISVFTVTTVAMPFNSLQEMVDQKAYTWGSVKGVALTMLFRDSTFDPYKTVHKGNHLVSSYEAGLSEVEAGGFAFITDKSWFLEVSNNNCDIVIMKEEFFPTSYAWAFPTGSPLRDMISKRIDKLTEAGVIAKWISDWIPRNSTCLNRPITESNAIKMTDIIGLLYIWWAGIGSSVFCFLLEICYVKFRDRHEVFKLI